MCPLLFSALESHLVQPNAGPVHATPLSVSSCVLVLCVSKALFSWCLPPSLALRIFLPPLLQSSLRPEVRDLIEISALGLSVPRSLTLYLMPSVSGQCFSGNSYGS